MTSELVQKDANDIQNSIDELLTLIDQAERKFRSARNWGFVDILGGGLLIDIIKHAKLGVASDIMNRINVLLQDLQQKLQKLVMPTDFSMNTATFASFADFLFDGILADVYMQSKIMSSMEQIKELRRRLLVLRSKLTMC